MIEFFLPNSRALLPTFRTNCPDWSHFAQMGLILPRIPPPTPVLYSAATKTFLGYVQTRNTPSPTPKHPFSLPDFESGQNELLSGQNGPHLAKCLKSGQNFSRSGQKKIFILSSMSSPDSPQLQTGSISMALAIHRP